MKKVSLKLGLLVAVLAATAGVAAWLEPARAQNAEEAAVRQAIEHYFRGHATGDGQHFQKVFHPEAKLFWMRDGKFAQRTSAEYIAGAPGKPAPDEAQRKRSIESIDITGNAAVVKVLLDYPSARLTDYMSMLKVDGEWKIVNKTFVSESKTR
ncbi:MAG TPA: nuclear transport factor 2 family protein [Pyrinomonadaceae bacterium]